MYIVFGLKTTIKHTYALASRYVRIYKSVSFELQLADWFIHMFEMCVYSHVYKIIFLNLAIVYKLRILVISEIVAIDLPF